jgi:uncharacterized protein YbbC (DUF1343 family)
MKRVATGLESFLDAPPAGISGQRLGLLCNPASVDAGLNHATQLIRHQFQGRLTAIFSPQHGFYSDKQDNMIESDDMVDPFTGIPVYSLYGKTRQPTREMFDQIDVLLVDIQDVGTRVYTFIYTMSYCMEAARQWGKKVIVLDRPNPVGGDRIEGNLLDAALTSFVGRYPVPMRHGLTIGELALLFNEHFGIHCDLEVVCMKGWRREMLFSETGLPWIAPSPNLPTWVSCLVYPGQVIWEGTNVSEGRGTTQPFELFGAPFIDPSKVLSFLNDNAIPGVFLRPVGFEPTSNKWAGHLCRGFQLHVTRPESFNSYGTSLRLLRAVIALFPDRFSWKSPPYEYDHTHLPIDLIIGNETVRKNIETNISIEEIENSFQGELDSFLEMRKSVLLYD